MSNYRIGDLIAFGYHGEYSHEPMPPQVLVLHTSWVRRNFPNETPKVHSLAWNYLADNEINYLKAIMNPTFAKQISQKDYQIRQQLMQVSAGSVTSGARIESPHDFYIRVIKPFINRHDSYRLYKPENMINVKVINKREVLTGQEKGLFSGYINKFSNLMKR